MRWMLAYGFTLLEVLLSLLLISFILLGLDATQIYALKRAKAHYFFSLATQQVNNLREQLYAGRQVIDINAQVANWNKQNHLLLPQGFGVLTGNFPNYVVTLYWGTMDFCAQTYIGESGCVKEKIS